MRGRTRAFVQVQNGCDHRCTFCIIPYGRGNSRSVPMGAVVEQVRTLVEHGSREVVLTGVDITELRQDLPGAPKLGTLVKSILRHVPELPRLRLSSIDSVEADDDLLDALATESAAHAASASLAPGRRRPHPEAHEAAPPARRRDPLLRRGAAAAARTSCSAPTSSPASRPRPRTMFARSLDLVDECGLTHLHVFPFSPRPGTPAARMPQVAREVVKERAARLREKGADGARAPSRRRGRRPPQRADRERRPRPHRGLHAGPLPGAGPRRRDPRGRDRRP